MFNISNDAVSHISISTVHEQTNNGRVYDISGQLLKYSIQDLAIICLMSELYIVQTNEHIFILTKGLLN